MCLTSSTECQYPEKQISNVLCDLMLIHEIHVHTACPTLQCQFCQSLVYGNPRAYRVSHTAVSVLLITCLWESMCIHVLYCSIQFCQSHGYSNPGAYHVSHTAASVLLVGYSLASVSRSTGSFLLGQALSQWRVLVLAFCVYTT